jgi:hypothetical protein
MRFSGARSAFPRWRGAMPVACTVAGALARCRGEIDSGGVRWLQRLSASALEGGQTRQAKSSQSAQLPKAAPSSKLAGVEHSPGTQLAKEKQVPRQASRATRPVGFSRPQSRSHARTAFGWRAFEQTCGSERLLGAQLAKGKREPHAVFEVSQEVRKTGRDAIPSKGLPVFPSWRAMFL